MQRLLGYAATKTLNADHRHENKERPLILPYDGSYMDRLLHFSIYNARQLREVTHDLLPKARGR